MNLSHVFLIGSFALVVLFGGRHLFRRFRSLRPQEPGFPYVWVNNRGRARELSAEERAYLNQKFDPFDGARPAIIFRYEKVDASEFKTGYLERRLLPPNVDVIRLTPEEDLHPRNATISLNQAVFEDRCPQPR